MGLQTGPWMGNAIPHRLYPICTPRTRQDLMPYPCSLRPHHLVSLRLLPCVALSSDTGGYLAISWQGGNPSSLDVLSQVSEADLAFFNLLKLLLAACLAL